jgi:hypothetical protein
LAKKLDKQAPAELAKILKPETILAWHRMLIAQKFDGPEQRKTPGRSKIGQGLEALVVRMAQEKRSWGYDRIVGALTNLGHAVSNQTVRNILGPTQIIRVHRARTLWIGPDMGSADTVGAVDGRADTK